MTILDVGAGSTRKRRGGRRPESGVAADVLADLDRFPYPFRDSSFDGLQAVHVIEHLPM